MSKTRPEVVQLLIGTDPHPPSEFRATGPLLNVAEFFTTFNIQPGDGLWRDQADQVVIW